MFPRCFLSSRRLGVAFTALPGGAEPSGPRKDDLPCLTAQRPHDSFLISKVSTTELNRTFAALVDPTRRAILLQLARKGKVSVGELARPFDIKLPAVTKHLGILQDAGLVTRTKVRRTVYCQLSPAALTRASRWIEQTTSFWETRLDNLADAMEKHRARR